MAQVPTPARLRQDWCTRPTRPVRLRCARPVRSMASSRGRGVAEARGGGGVRRRRQARLSGTMRCIPGGIAFRAAALERSLLRGQFPAGAACPLGGVVTPEDGHGGTVPACCGYVARQLDHPRPPPATAARTVTATAAAVRLGGTYTKISPSLKAPRRSSG